VLKPCASPLYRSKSRAAGAATDPCDLGSGHLTDLDPPATGARGAAQAVRVWPVVSFVYHGHTGEQDLMTHSRAGRRLVFITDARRSRYETAEPGGTADRGAGEYYRSSCRARMCRGRDAPFSLPHSIPHRSVTSAEAQWTIDRQVKTPPSTFVSLTSRWREARARVARG
jgi:hypothetical protein